MWIYKVNHFRKYVKAQLSLLKHFFEPLTAEFWILFFLFIWRFSSDPRKHCSSFETRQLWFKRDVRYTFRILIYSSQSLKPMFIVYWLQLLAVNGRWNSVGVHRTGYCSHNRMCKCLNCSTCSYVRIENGNLFAVSMK